MNERRHTIVETRPTLRRGLSRIEAATYIGVSPTKFDEMRATGRAPRARILDGRKLWDARELDLLFEALPLEDSAPAVVPTEGGSWNDR